MKQKIITAIHLTGGVAILTAALLFSGDAAAAYKPTGFRWVTPEQLPLVIGGEAKPAPVKPAPMPSGTIPLVPDKGYEPLVIEGEPAPAPVASPSASADLSWAPSADMTSSAVSNGMVKGFGDNLPLSVALRQVLPPSYAYSLGPGVNIVDTVSWRGDRPWEEVLQNMLATKGYEGRMDGQVVRIMRKGDSQVAELAPAPAPMPVMVEPAPMENLPPIDAAPLANEPVVSQPIPMPTPMLDQPAPSMPVMPMAMPAVATDGAWVAERGRMLREILSEWSSRAGADLVWRADYDFPMNATLRFNGSYEEAVAQLLSAFENARPQPHGRLHDNPAVGQRILVVEARGNNYGE